MVSLHRILWGFVLVLRHYLFVICVSYQHVFRISQYVCMRISFIFHTPNLCIWQLCAAGYDVYMHKRVT